MRLLVVDGDATARTTLRGCAQRVAQQRNVTVECILASGYSEGIRVIQDDISCAIIDRMLGDGDGAALVENMLGRRGLGAIVALLAGHGVDAVVQARLFRLGAFIFQKPVAPFELLDAMFGAVLARQREAPRPSTSSVRLATVRDDLESEKQARIAVALAKTHGNITHAAQLLGVNRQWVQRNMKRGA